MSSIPNGFINPSTPWSLYSNIDFMIQQSLLKLQTSTLVEVLSCTNSGGLSPVGTVNVKPMVNQVDADGNAWPHTTIYNVPYSRIQGGQNGNAIVMDPQKGDIGVALFASRDISKVLSTSAAANPGSARKYDFSDAMYIGGLLNGGTPTQYIQFGSSGITIVSPNAITIKAPTINLEGNVVQTAGTITVQTDVIAGMGAVSLVNHLHDYGIPAEPTTIPL
jgi:hypothetical protein